MSDAWLALAGYVAIAVVVTWPLVRGLGRDVAWDLGDSLLVMWTLAWDGEQMLGVLSGDFSRVSKFFDGNMFHPAPMTLAYSEHFTAQAIQILPIYALTRNPILCYNLLFLSTFVLSGLGTYLFVRDLTGRRGAAFVAGLLFAFAPYRVPQSSHLHVLSAQWMPFALFAFRRYVIALETGRPSARPLAGAAASLILQNLSCGYYLLYFSPFAAAYILWELLHRDLWRRWRVWAQVSGAAVAVLAITLPFLLPYLAVNEQLRFERSRTEVIRFSADVYSYATAFGEQPLWGDVMRGHPKPEGDLFPGLVPVVLALIAIVAAPRRSRPRTPEAPNSPVSRWVRVLLAAGCVAHVVAAIAGLLYRRIVLDFWIVDVQITNVNQMLVRGSVFGALLLLVSPGARERARVFARGPGFFVVALLAAMWLSLGPAPQVQGRPVELAAPYEFLYEVVPGFEGVRAPARLAMVATLMLAVLGGFGAARLAQWRHAPVVLSAISVAFLAESVVVPFTVNGVTVTPGFHPPEARVYRPQRAPNIYKAFAREAPDGVLAELPLGESDFDLRAVYYSTAHWRPVLNGYSGYYPPHYGKLALALRDVPRFPDAALQALQTYGATHVIVHEGAYVTDRGVGTTATLQQHGARELYREGSDVLLQLR